MESQATNLFVLYGGLALLAAIVCWPLMDVAGVFAISIAIYAMLVAANGIDRGEKRSRRR